MIKCIFCRWFIFIDQCYQSAICHPSMGLFWSTFSWQHANLQPLQDHCLTNPTLIIIRLWNINSALNVLRFIDKRVSTVYDTVDCEYRRGHIRCCMELIENLVSQGLEWIVENMKCEMHSGDGSVTARYRQTLCSFGIHYWEESAFQSAMKSMTIYRQRKEPNQQGIQKQTDIIKVVAKRFLWFVFQILCQQMAQHTFLSLFNY